MKRNCVLRTIIIIIIIFRSSFAQPCILKQTALCAQRNTRFTYAYTYMELRDYHKLTYIIKTLTWNLVFISIFLFSFFFFTVILLCFNMKIFKTHHAPYKYHVGDTE